MQFILDFFRNFFNSLSMILSFGRKKLTNSLSIYVKSNTGKGTISLELNPECDIKDVKELVAPQLGLSPEEVKIIFAGKELSDSTQISVSIFSIFFSFLSLKVYPSLGM